MRNEKTNDLFGKLELVLYFFGATRPCNGLFYGTDTAKARWRANFYRIGLYERIYYDGTIRRVIVSPRRNKCSE